MVTRFPLFEVYDLQLLKKIGNVLVKICGLRVICCFLHKLD